MDELRRLCGGGDVLRSAVVALGRRIGHGDLDLLVPVDVWEERLDLLGEAVWVLELQLVDRIVGQRVAWEGEVHPAFLDASGDRAGDHVAENVVVDVGRRDPSVEFLALAVGGPELLEQEIRRWARPGRPASGEGSTRWARSWRSCSSLSMRRPAMRTAHVVAETACREGPAALRAGQQHVDGHRLSS